MLFGNIVSTVSGGVLHLMLITIRKQQSISPEKTGKIAEMQFEYNKEEISRAFDSNLRAVLREQLTRELEL